MAEFKFKIGQIVTTKESKGTFTFFLNEAQIRKSLLPSGPVAMTVVARLREECSGGVQLFYDCTYFTQHGYARTRFHEVELEEHPQIKAEMKEEA